MIAKHTIVDEMTAFEIGIVLPKLMSMANIKHTVHKLHALKLVYIELIWDLVEFYHVHYLH